MTAEADNDNGNGRVTLAKLGEKMDNMSELIHDLATKLERHCEQSNVRDNRLTKLETIADTNAKEIATLRTKGDFWDSINSLGVIVAGILGVNK